MDRLKPILSFALLAALVFGALRLVHLMVPVLYPKVLAGPFSLESIEQVEEYAGFAPRVPFYRPQTLGARPVNVTVERRPFPRMRVFWQGEHFLVLEETRGGPQPLHLPSDHPLPGHPGAAWWTEGRTQHVVYRLDDLWIDLRTDLPPQDVQRLVDTLRPYRELL